MKKTALALISALSLAACASTKSSQVEPADMKAMLTLPETETPKTALSKPNIDELQNPFESKEDEALFWAIMNDEIDPSKLVAMGPIVKLARTLQMALSPRSPAPLREAALNVLLKDGAILLMRESDRYEYLADIHDEDMVSHWQAMNFLFGENAHLIAALRYVLADEQHIKEFFIKEQMKIKKSLDNKSKPAPKNLDPIPSPNDGKLEHNL